MSKWIQKLRDRRATDDRTGEIQLASGHTEDCKLDDEQRRMRRSADAAHSRPLIGAPPLQPLPIWQKATGTPYVIDLEMETSAAVGVAQTGRCIVDISALRCQLQGTRGHVMCLTFRTIGDRTGSISSSSVGSSVTTKENTEYEVWERQLVPAKAYCTSTATSSCSDAAGSDRRSSCALNQHVSFNLGGSISSSSVGSSVTTKESTEYEMWERQLVPAKAYCTSTATSSYSDAAGSDRRSSGLLPVGHSIRSEQQGMQKWSDLIRAYSARTISRVAGLWEMV